jgi:hypothetical protein
MVKLNVIVGEAAPWGIKIFERLRIVFRPGSVGAILILGIFVLVACLTAVFLT